MIRPHTTGLGWRGAADFYVGFGRHVGLCIVFLKTFFTARVYRVFRKTLHNPTYPTFRAAQTDLGGRGAADFGVEFGRRCPSSFRVLPGPALTALLSIARVRQLEASKSG